MPVERGRDSKGSFYRWGATKHKYYYKTKNKQSREIAKNKAKKQGKAIKISQSKK